MNMKQASLTIWITTLTLTLLVATIGIPLATATHELPVPVAWWKLDETEGTTAEDSAGTNDGTLCGDNPGCTPPGGPTVNQPGKVGTAYTFDGVNDRVSVPDADALEQPNFSISAWVVLNDFAPPSHISARILDKTNAATDGYYLLVRTEDTHKIRFGIAGAFSDSTDPIELGEFTHLAGTYDGSIIRLYVNGLLVGSTSHGAGLLTNSLDLSIGNSAGQNRAWLGTIDDVRIYDSAITASDVMDLYLDPEHHPCTNYAADETVTTVGPLLVVGVALALIAAVLAFIHGRRKAAGLAVLAPILFSPTATATHDCLSGSGGTLASMLPFFAALIILLMIVLPFMRKRVGQ